MTLTRSDVRSRRVAIIGGGVSGIACMWKLKDTTWSIDMFDAASKIGGHANSTPFRMQNKSINVDTGFIAMDEATYSQFNAFLQELNVKTIPTDMSFGVSVNQGSFEWGSRSLWSFIGDFANLFNLWFWRLLFDLIRFFIHASDIAERGQAQLRTQNRSLKFDQLTLEHHLTQSKFESIGHFLKRHGYSDHFLRLVLIPMVAAPWCTDPEDFSQSFPAEPLIQFMHRHSLLDVISKTLRWRSFRNGSITYVDAFQSLLPSSCRIFLNSRVEQVSRSEDQVSVRLADSSVLSYDHVVLAVHAHQALRLLSDEATKAERNILACFKTSKNVCYLHSDTSLMPRRASARMAWNCLLQDQDTISDTTGILKKTTEAPKSRISLTFDMNKLQDIQGFGKVLVTMNPVKPPLKFQSVHEYEHPMINSEAMIASQYLHHINGVSSVSFAGAWMGWGFHEDGFASGAHVANMLIQGSDGTPKLDLFGFSATISRECRPKAFRLLLMRWLVAVVQSCL